MAGSGPTASHAGIKLAIGWHKPFERRCGGVEERLVTRLFLLPALPRGLQILHRPPRYRPFMSVNRASLPLQMLYVTVDGYMMAFDLATDKIAWTFAGESAPVPHTRGAASGCCERPWTLPDGKTLLVGSSYNGWWYYIDGATGKVLSKVPVPEAPVAHNLVVSADGKLGILASMSSPKDGKAGAAIVDVPNRKVMGYMTFSEMVRPLTMTHDARLVYVNVNDLIGFEIGDIKTGKKLKRVELPGGAWKGKGYSHGIGMTPDESEIWIDSQRVGNWFTVDGDIFGTPDPNNLALHQEAGGSLVLTYWPSEFSQIRGQLRRTQHGGNMTANEFLFQFQFSIGAHGAHPF